MNWGILGLGTIAKKFAKAVNLMSEQGERLVAVGSRSIEHAKEFADEYGAEKCYGSYEELAQASEIDAVYIATPNNLHYENCKMCLLNGKNVLCEKPFTINENEARELYELAREKGLFIMEGLWTWHLPIYKKIREIVESGSIGNVEEIKCQYGFVASGARKDRKFASELGGGALLDIGIYNLGFIYNVTRMMPEHFDSKVDINEYGTDEYSSIRMTFENGCVAEAIQTIGTVLDRKATIRGTKGQIILDDFQQAYSMKLLLDGKEEIIEIPYQYDDFEYEIGEVSRCVSQGMNSSDVYTSEHSIALTELMHRIRISWNMKFKCE